MMTDIVFKKTDLGSCSFLQVGVRNEPQQIQDVGVHCVHPGLPQNNYLKHYIKDVENEAGKSDSDSEL